MRSAFAARWPQMLAKRSLRGFTFIMLNPRLRFVVLLCLHNPWSVEAAFLGVDDLIATDIGTSAVSTDQAILKISPGNGDRTVISGNGLGTGATMNTPNTGGGGT